MGRVGCERILQRKTQRFQAPNKESKTKKGRPASTPKMCASCWRTAISRNFSHKKWEKVLEVSRRLPPASTINDLMSTDPAKEAITILNKRSTGHLVRSQEFISVRDFLIVRLELENV